MSRDFTGNNNPLTDTDGHGTNVAGVIGANTDNIIGVAGVCWDVDLVSLKVGLQINEWNFNCILDAINYAKANGIDILNFSGFYRGNNDPGFLPVINSYHGLFVCIAGNDGLNVDYDPNDPDSPSGMPYYPACCTSQNLIAVTGVLENGSFDSRRNFGKISIDLAAPGDDIMTTDLGENYMSYDATSMAAPFVSGVAVLMLSVNPSLTPLQIKNIMIDNVDSHYSLLDKVKSGGRINAYRSVLAAKNYTTFDTPFAHGGQAFCDSGTPWFSTSSSIRVFPADINGDNQTDIVGVDYDGNICYSLCNDNGSYSAQAKITVANALTPSWFSSSYNQRVWFDDVNGDGYDDLMGISVAGKMFTALNNKNLTFSAVSMCSTGTAFVSSSGWFSTAHSGRVWTGDINGDNKADFIGISTAGHVYYALGNGNGGFNNEVKINISNALTESWFLATSRPRVWLTDINGDNKDDFIGVSNAGKIFTIINNGNYTFKPVSDNGGVAFKTADGWFSTTYSDRVWPGDINGDGIMDIMGLDTNGNIHYSVGNSNINYSEEFVINVTNGYNTAWISSNYNPRLWVVNINSSLGNIPDQRADFVGVNINGNFYTSEQRSLYQ